MKTKTTLKGRADIIDAIIRQIRKTANTRPAGNRWLVYLPAVWGRTLVYNPAKTRPVIHLTPRPGDLIIQLPAASEATPDATAIKHSLTHPRYVRTIGIVDGDQGVSYSRCTRWITFSATAIVDNRGGCWILNDRRPRHSVLLRHVLPTSGRLRADFDTIAGDRTQPADAPTWLDKWDGTSTRGCVHMHGTQLACVIDSAVQTVWCVALASDLRITRAAVSGQLYRHLRGAIPVPGVRLSALGYTARAARARITPGQVHAVRDMLCSSDGIAWMRAANTKH